MMIKWYNKPLGAYPNPKDYEKLTFIECGGFNNMNKLEDNKKELTNEEKLELKDFTMGRLEEKLLQLGYKKYQLSFFKKFIAFDTYIYCRVNDEKTIIDEFYASGSTWLWSKKTMDKLLVTFNNMKEEAEQLKEFFDEELKETWRCD